MRGTAAGRVARLLPVLLLAGCAAGRPAPVEDRAAGATGAGVAVLPATPDRAAAAVPPTDGDDAAAGVTILPLDAPATEGAAAAPVQGAPSVGTVEPATGGGAVNPAVVALLNRANQESSAGRHAGAAAALERAIRIEPGNAWLWHRLAQARLAEGRGGEAAALAARSNALAAADTRLQAENWLLIARVHRQRGEEVAAREAERRARELGAPAS